MASTSDDNGFVFNADPAISENDENDDVWNAVELTIFLVDCSMQCVTASESYLKTCFECCRAFMIRKITSQSRDLVGIVFYGVREKDVGNLNAEHVITYFSPKIPDAEIIKKLDRMIESNDLDDFVNSYGHSNSFSISDALWHCSSILHKCAKICRIKTIIIATSVSDPHENDPVQQYQARQRTADLSSVGVRLKMLLPDNQFCLDHFYQELLDIANPVLKDNCIFYANEKLNELVTRANRKDYQKRSVGKVNFYLNDTTCIGVSIYNFYRTLKLPSTVNLDRSSNDQLLGVRETVSSTTGEQLLRSDVVKYCEFGEEQVKFSHTEIADAAPLCKLGFTLLGFKSIELLTPTQHCRPSSFIYPNEKAVTGSEQLFVALVRRCYERKKFALCWLLSRFKGKPSLVALVPECEQRDENGMQIWPEGFSVIYIPFGDNIREINVECSEEELTQQQKDSALGVVKKLTFNYSVAIFEDPELQTHWANVEALALDYADVKPVNDLTSVDYDALSERLAQRETSFIDAFSLYNYDPEQTITRKRYGQDITQSRPAKMTKSPMEDDSLIELVEQTAQNGNIEKLTVEKLRAYLKLKGEINTYGMKKSDLLNALRKHLKLN